MSNEWDILGRQVVRDLEMLGAGGPSFDWSTLINAGAEAASKGIEYKQAQDAASASSADMSARGKKAIAADQAWADAETTLALAQQSKDPAKIAAAQNLASAMQTAAVAAGAGLTSDAADKRLAAAQDMATKAAQAALANTSSGAAQAKMTAWQKVLSSVAAGGASASSSAASTAMVPHAGHGGGNFFTQKLGPLPVWGWGLVGVGTLGGIALLLRRRK